MQQGDSEFAREARGIWQRLSAADVSHYVEKKNGLAYLSWAWAWGILMENYPGATFWWDRTDKNEEHIELRDGTVEVRCTVCINGVQRTMWLPVMDHKNKAIVDPDAFAVNKAKMRCLVKCLALFGLGFSIYAGEDLPDDEPAERQPRKPAERKAAARRSSGPEPHGATGIDSFIADIEQAATLETLRTIYTRNHLFLANKGMTAEMARLTTAKDLRKAQLEGAA